MDMVAHSIAMSGRHWSMALALAQDAAATDLQLDTVALNGVLGTLAAAAPKWSRAMALFRSRLHLRSLRPSAVTFSTVTAVCGRCDLWEMAFQVTNQLRSNGLEANLVAQSAAIGACVTLWQKSFNLAGELTDLGLTGNTVLFGSTMAACREWTEGLSLLMDLQGQAVLVNTVVMNSLITGATSWQSSLMLFKVGSQYIDETGVWLEFHVELVFLPSFPNTTMIQHDLA